MKSIQKWNFAVSLILDADYSDYKRHVVPERISPDLLSAAALA
jgi:hypothetical protein